jgi:ribonuclease HI
MYYAVKSGRNTGIYNTWKECEAQIKGFSGARFKKFNTKEEALQFIGITISTINKSTCDMVYTDGSSWNGKMGLGIFYERRNNTSYPKL